MASQPVKRDAIEALARKADDLPELAHLPHEEKAFAYLCAYMANGGRLSQLAASLNVSRWLLDRWVKGDEERKAAFSRARAEGADALVDEGGDLLDSATRDTIAVANARAGWRKWLASKYDPTTWGDSQPTQGVTHLHLHALQAPRPLPIQSPPLNGSLDGQRVVGYPTETQRALPVLPVQIQDSVSQGFNGVVLREGEGFHVEHPPQDSGKE